MSCPCSRAMITDGTVMCVTGGEGTGGKRKKERAGG